MMGLYMQKFVRRFVLAVVAVAAGYLLFVLFGDKLIDAGQLSTNKGKRPEVVGNSSYDKNAGRNSDSQEDVDSEYLTLVNKEHHLEAGYAPEDLVEAKVACSANVSGEEKKLRKDAAMDLEALFRSAKAEGIVLCAVSGYRSYKFQRQLYNEKLKARGKAYVKAYVAEPGESEHQTGLAMDVGGFIPLNKSNNFDFGQTKEGKWLKENAYKFGFILRYPKGMEKLTGYGYEPWHIRYVGLKAAEEINNKGVVLEEYLE